MNCYLCIDCGLTKLKVVLVEVTGKVICEKSYNTPLKNHLIETAKLKDIIIEAVKEVINCDCLKNGKILAITTSGHGNGLYIIDKKDSILPFGFSSMFSENQSYVPESKLTLPITSQTSWTGQPLAILAYLKSKKPEIFVNIKKILFCKDVIKYFLTSRVVTDYTDASAAGLLNFYNSKYDKELLKIYGLEDYQDILPELHRCTDIVGNVSQKFSEMSGLEQGIPVVCGLFDVNSCMLGAGVYKAEKYCIISGTWGINSAVLKEKITNPQITQCCNFVYPERFTAIDSAPTSCVNLEWFLKNILQNIDYSKADEIVNNQPFDEKLIYLPYIYSPMDINIDGGFIGLKASHTYKDMLRAVFEGIVFEHAWRIEKLKKIGICYDTAVLTGGAANSEIFCQMFADVTGLKIQTVTEAQTGVLGGAIICSVAIGIYYNIESAVNDMVKVKNIYYPKNDFYKDKFNLFKNIIVLSKERGS